jgi:hypothetical protein
MTMVKKTWDIPYYPLYKHSLWGARIIKTAALIRIAAAHLNENDYHTFGSLALPNEETEEVVLDESLDEVQEGSAAKLDDQGFGLGSGEDDEEEAVHIVSLTL